MLCDLIDMIAEGSARVFMPDASYCPACNCAAS
jgi:hypothetical protein